MKKFALSFICKDEQHIIERMLHSALPLTDLIVAVDTGSSDNTIALIQAFGDKHNVPTFVFQRPFDNFGNSRNFALDKLRETVHTLEWDPNSTWGFRMDCDELLEINEKFIKENITSDLCHASLHYKDYKTEIKSKRQLFFRLSRDFVWEGPVHEYLIYTPHTVTKAQIPEIDIIRQPLGATWKENQENKNLKYIAYFKKYIEEGHREFKWHFHIAETYIDAAGECDSKERRVEYFTQAQKYFEEAIILNSDTRDERYKAYQGMASNKARLERGSDEVREAFLQAYGVDKRHAEPIYNIILNNIKINQWQTAYLYSSFAMVNYHENKPLDEDITKVEDSIYEWRLLYNHITICFNTQRVGEGKSGIKKLKTIIRQHADFFSYKEKVYINTTLLLLRMGLYNKQRKTASTSEK